MECKNCKKEVDDSFVFCPYCGHRTDGKKVCGKCGALIDEEFVFCPVCGTKSVGEGENVKNASAKSATAAYDNKAEEAAEAEVLISEDTGSSEAVDTKKADKAGSKGTMTWVKSALSRINGGLVNRIALAVIAAVILICSFFGVINYDATEFINDLVGEEIKFDGKIKVELSAVDLASIGFFAMTLDYDKAREYMKESDYNEIIYDIEDIFYDDEYTKVTSARITVNSKGCRKISSLVSDVDVFKYSYAQSVYRMGDDDDSSVGVSLQVLGLLALVNILCASVVFILAIINLFKEIFKEGVGLIAAAFFTSVGLWAVASGTGSANIFDGLRVSMGGALATIVAFAVIFFAYRLVVKLTGSRKINVKQLVAGLAAVVTGAIVLGTASASVINTTLTYEQTGDRDVEFKYSFSQFETFDEYYFDLGKGNYVNDSVIKENFDSDAQYYIQYDYEEDSDLLMKSNFGLKAFTNNSFFSKTNAFAKPLIRLQPVISLFAIYAAALMLSAGLVGLCGKEGKVRLKVLSIILFILAAGFGIAIPILLNAVFDASTKLTMIELSVGAAPIVMLVFAVTGAIGFGVANIFKNKEITFSKKSERSEI